MNDTENPEPQLYSDYPEYWEDQYYQHDLFEELERLEGE